MHGKAARKKKPRILSEFLSRGKQSTRRRLKKEEDGKKSSSVMQQHKKEEGGGGGKTVLVGIKMDADGRELLTWSLVKAADAGDRVVALHVLPSHSSDASLAGRASLLSLIKAFNAVLAVFDGLCELKEVDLEMKIAGGSSVRKVLVREAISVGASKLVLGVAKCNRAVVYPSTSVAKYCARKLPRACSVLAVSNGKTLFKREEEEAAPAAHLAAVQRIRSEADSESCSPQPVANPNQSSSNCCNTNSDAKKDQDSTSPELDANTTTKVGEDCGKAREIRIPRELEHLQQKYSSVCRVFSYMEVVHMTSDFSPENLIGKGGSSHVYKGCLPDGKELALKTLKSSKDEMGEFASEIEILTALQHKNIVSLLGFCCENDKLTLVYNFLPRGSLEDNLHGWSSKLGWDERFKIAVGVAEALSYLHSTSDSQSVIHRDVKSSNILLADNLEPQLADFGLAMWASASASQLICNDVAGTFGYLAPEYFMYGKVNEKIDIYAFGVVLLELVSGRKPVTSGCPKGQESLVLWAMPILQGGKFEELVDPCLGATYEKGQPERMVLTASLCIKQSPRSRPPMTIVLKLLQGNDNDDDVLQWTRSQNVTPVEVDEFDEEAVLKNNNMQSHINLAMQDVEDDTFSISSIEPPTANMSMEEYLRGRWSRSSSFD
ncbi:putative serine/threonine-protein kinase PBL6 [Canna indica]|uniref:Serine/threonine-protein kinase PBL6 n=1 Tax=Canna indica TaxID=4628 RepID=A0AAQ3QC41_9LILI|nr:putative serine/threonine-protein kinase PBL6 [Canna indica]